MFRPDPIRLLHEGIALEEAEHKAQESTKVGTLRGGNTGCLVQTDFGLKAIGACPRLALLRMLGMEVRDGEDKGQENSKQHMWQNGHANEDGWADWLGRSWGAQGGVLLRETEVPTRWETRNGTPVTGRPDIVLADASGKLVLGLELKQASSMWTVRDILRDKPKTAHLCQAGHYSMALGSANGAAPGSAGLPFDLLYRSSVNYHIFGKEVAWVGRHFPRYGQRHSDKCEYKLGEPQPATAETTYKNGKVKPGKPAKPAFQEIFRVLPFVHGFNTRWADGTLEVKPSDLGDDAWEPSLITEEGIREYFESAANALTTDVLPPEPVAMDHTGQALGWRACTYCPLQAVCDKHAAQDALQSTQAWMKDVQAAIAQP